MKKYAVPARIVSNFLAIGANEYHILDADRNDQVIPTSYLKTKESCSVLEQFTYTKEEVFLLSLRGWCLVICDENLQPILFDGEQIRLVRKPSDFDVPCAFKHGSFTGLSIRSIIAFVDTKRQYEGFLIPEFIYCDDEYFLKNYPNHRLI